MRTAYRVLGLVALAAGAIGLFVPAALEGSSLLKNLFGIVLLLSGFILIRGAPESPARPAAPVRDPGPEVEELARRGEIIPAIKRYRELHGASLKEAKDAVDAIRAGLRGGGP